MNERFGSSLNSESKWGTLRQNFLVRHIYGSAGSNHVYHNSRPEIEGTWADVNVAQSKPVLLEAKQCMRCFDISVIGIKTPSNQGSNNNSGSNNVRVNMERYYDNDYGYYDNTPLGIILLSFIIYYLLFIIIIIVAPSIKSPKKPTIRNGSVEFETYVRFSVRSHMDHIEDIQTEINFQVFTIILTDVHINTNTNTTRHCYYVMEL